MVHVRVKLVGPHAVAGLTLPPRAYNVVAQATDLEYLRRYIPAAVHKRLEAGHDAYIAEIRQVGSL